MEGRGGGHLRGPGKKKEGSQDAVSPSAPNLTSSCYGVQSGIMQCLLVAVVLAVIIPTAFPASMAALYVMLFRPISELITWVDACLFTIIHCAPRPIL